MVLVVNQKHKITIIVIFLYVLKNWYNIDYATRLCTLLRFLTKNTRSKIEKPFCQMF